MANIRQSMRRTLYATISFMLLSCFGCSKNSEIEGTITDFLSGKGVPGVTISIKDTAFQTVTDSSGKYLFKNIPPGNTTIKIEKAGWAVPEPFVINIGERTKVPLETKQVLNDPFVNSNQGIAFYVNGKLYNLQQVFGDREPVVFFPALYSMFIPSDMRKEAAIPDLKQSSSIKVITKSMNLHEFSIHTLCHYTNEEYARGYKLSLDDWFLCGNNSHSFKLDGRMAFNHLYSMGSLTIYDFTSIRDLPNSLMVINRTNSNQITANENENFIFSP